VKQLVDKYATKLIAVSPQRILQQNPPTTNRGSGVHGLPSGGFEDCTELDADFGAFERREATQNHCRRGARVGGRDP